MAGAGARVGWSGAVFAKWNWTVQLSFGWNATNYWRYFIKMCMAWKYIDLKTNIYIICAKMRQSFSVATDLV